MPLMRSGPSARIRPAAAIMAGLLFVGLAACSSSTPEPVPNASNLATSSQAPDAGSKGGTFAYRFNPGVVQGSDTDPLIGGAFLTPVDAIVGIPDGDTPRPVVYLVHGTHANCVQVNNSDSVVKGAPSTPWKEVCGQLDDEVAEDADLGYEPGPDWVSYQAGLSYLANALREAGYVTVSVDAGAVSANFIGETGSTFGQIETTVRIHQKLLADFAAGNTHGITMPANTTKVLGSKKFAVVGHSTGGGWAMERATTNDDPNFFAAVGLQAAIGGRHEEDPLPKPTHPVPSLAYYGTCDEDVFYEAGSESVKRLSDEVPTWPVLSYTLPGATHLGVNTSTNQDAILGVAKGEPGCDAPNAIMTPGDMQAGFAAATVAFIQQAEKGSTSFTLPKNATFKATDLRLNHLTGELVETANPTLDHSTPQVQVIDEQVLTAWDPIKDPVILKQD